MPTSNRPFRAPTHTGPPPGLGLPVLGLALVFVLGLICVGLIYAVGQPIEETVAVAEPPEVEQPKTPVETTAVAEPYVSPGGTSPLPKHGEPEAPPIEPTRLIDEEAFNAEPPMPSELPTPDEPVAWDRAHLYLGKVITVKGTIVDTHLVESGEICFLNYDPDWQGKFYIAMFKEAFELLPDPPDTHYLDKTLLVTGKVTMHRDRPQIEVHDASQIEVLESR